MTKDNKYKPTKTTKGDAAHAIVRAGLGAIPVAGSAATELFNAIVVPPLERRRSEWMEQVGDALRKLEEQKGVSLEGLQNNDIFLDTVMHASQAALRNSQKEKLTALRNAVLNAALPNPPEESIQQMFVNFIDSLTVWHLKVLDLVQNPEEWARRHNHTFPNLMGGGFSLIIESAFPELYGRRDFYDQLGKDLSYRGLANTDHLHVLSTGQDLLRKKTTSTGDSFLKFITSPFEEEQS